MAPSLALEDFVLLLLAVADSNQYIRIREKTLEFSIMLPALSPYTNIIIVIDTLTLFVDEYCEEDRVKYGTLIFFQCFGVHCVNIRTVIKHAQFVQIFTFGKPLVIIHQFR